ncbi:caspase family protein [Streptomyces sp. KL116D]|uniref:effector-associated domain 2-containing protein n=1 Tax=Streptomyces sp. KL116D TaxID=3045152 RepID=UPI0035560040
MPTPTVPPDRVHALVVGIERYAVGDRWTLPGPVCDALRFRDWLLGHDVPEGNILLHLAAEPGRRIGVEHRPADHADLRHTLVNELPRAGSDLLWIWWGGHGFLDRGDRLRLITADATSHDMRNINLESVLAYYRTEAATRHPSQVWMVDACATFERELHLYATPPDEELPMGRPWEALRQMELRAARRGTRALNDPVARAGHWSTLVLGRLRELDDVGRLPDAAFLDALRNDVRERERAGAPVPWLRLRGASGDFDVAPSGTRGGGEYGTAEECDAMITDLVRRAWATRPESRQTLVDALPSTVRDQIPRASAPRHDIVTIVQAAARIRGGLAALRQAVRRLDGDAAAP